MAETTISKIKLIDGTIVNLSSILKLNIPPECLTKLDVTWEVNNFTGSVSKISGTENDYLLTVPSLT